MNDYRLERILRTAAIVAAIWGGAPAQGAENVLRQGFVPAHERANAASASMRVVGAGPSFEQGSVRQASHRTSGSVLAEAVPAPAGVADSIGGAVSGSPDEWFQAEGGVEMIPGEMSTGEEWIEGEMPFGGEFSDPFGGDCGCDGGPGCEGGACSGGCDGGGWYGNHPGLRALFKHMQFSAGSHAFKNPGNRGGESSFGFHQGINFSANVPHLRALSFQVGAQVTESNLNGSIFTDDDRIQLFATGGLFRRVDAGFQGGVVVDYLHDEWDYDVDLLQLRGEISHISSGRHEVGFFTAINTREKLIQDPFLGPTLLDTTDLFALFYRCRFQNLAGSETRIYGGASGDSDGLVGGDFLLPVCQNLALQLDYAYLIPADTLRAGTDESWNLSFSLVWYPGCGFTTPTNYCRPLFNVANNGSMMLNDAQ